MKAIYKHPCFNNHYFVVNYEEDTEKYGVAFGGSGALKRARQFAAGKNPSRSGKVVIYSSDWIWEDSNLV